MSAPTTHDPLVVNTKDGTTWSRRAVTQDGHGLYAVTDSCKCPEYLLATLAELAERGIVGSAYALPVPVGPVPQPLPADRLTEIAARVQAATAGPWWTDTLAEHDGSESVGVDAGDDNWIVPCQDLDPADAEFIAHARADVEWLIGRVAELERLLAEDDCSCPPADHPHQVGCPLDLPAPGSQERPVNALTSMFAPVAALREDVYPQVEKLRTPLGGQRAAVEDPHDSPLHHPYRVGHDLPELGGAL